MTAQKDDPAVIKFMRLFRSLRDMIDDDPTGLEALAADDESIRRLCIDLNSVATILSISERRCRQIFAAPVNPKFIEEWRDYEERYASPLAGIFFMDLDLDLSGSRAVGKSEFDVRWEYADDAAKEQAKAIEAAIDFAKDQLSTKETWSDDNVLREYLDHIEEGAAAWGHLASATGFDLRGIFRRRELVPFVLIPRHVSEKHGQAEKLSLFTHLRQSHEAFVFGIPFAVLALMRSILETTLVKHYHMRDKDLEERIDNCQRLPRQVAKRDLHRLRHLANDILHFNNDQVRLPQDMEKEILHLLYVLRALIEGAPAR